MGSVTRIPRVKLEPKTEEIRARIPASLKRAVNQHLARNKKPFSAWIRDVMQRAIDLEKEEPGQSSEVAEAISRMRALEDQVREERERLELLAANKTLK